MVFVLSLLLFECFYTSKIRFIRILKRSCNLCEDKLDRFWKISILSRKNQNVDLLFNNQQTIFIIAVLHCNYYDIN